eukprot:g5175.t1
MDTGEIDPSLDDPGMSMPSFIMEPTTADIRRGMRQLAAERRAVVLQTLFTIEVADASKQSKGLDPSTRERNIRAAVKTAHENATPGHTDAMPLLEGSAEERKAQQRALGDLDDLDDLRSVLDKLAVLDEIMFQREMAALGQQGQMTLQNVRRLVAKFSGMELARSNRDVHYQLRKKSSAYTSKVELDRLQLFASGTEEFLSVATTTDHTAVYGGESGWRAGQAAAADGAAAVGEGGEVVVGAGAAEEADGAPEEPDDESSSSSDGEEDEIEEAGLELGAVSDVNEDEDEDEV